MPSTEIAERINAAAAALQIDLATDADDLAVLHAEQCCEQYDGQPVYSSLAMALNVQMICDDNARAAYREIWGREWEAVPPIAYGTVAPRRSPRFAIGTESTTSTEPTTVGASPRAMRR